MVHSLQKIEAYRQLLEYVVSEGSTGKSPQHIIFLFKDSGFDIPDAERTTFVNYIRAHKWIEDNFSTSRRVIIGDILYLHKILLEGNTEKIKTGKYRDTYDIYPTYLSLVYLPKPSEIERQMSDLVMYINDIPESFPIIKASLVLLHFLRISPFRYGNFYLSQLLFSLLLQKENYQIKNTFFSREYLETEKLFKFLGEDIDENMTVSYLEYLLEGICKSTETAKDQLIRNIQFPKKEKLIPKLETILTIIKKKNIVTLKQLSVSFPDITSRTLSYHLKNLTESGFITKKGTTRGCVYTLKNKKTDYLDSGDVTKILQIKSKNPKIGLIE